MADSYIAKELENILGATNDLEEPKSRIAKILYAMLGNQIEIEEPQSVIGELLKEILDNGGTNTPTSNLWGGLQMAVDIPKNCSGGFSLNPDDGFVSLTASSTIDGAECKSGIFESNTQYTLILAFENDAGGTIQANMMFKYTDDTEDVFNISGSADTKYTIAFVSARGKTISKIQCVYADGTSKIYYEESGLFEGVKSVEDFEPYNRYNAEEGA